MPGVAIIKCSNSIISLDLSITSQVRVISLGTDNVGDIDKALLANLQQFTKQFFAPIVRMAGRNLLVRYKYVYIFYSISILYNIIFLESYGEWQWFERK